MPSPNNPMGRQILGGAIAPVYIAGSEVALSVTGGLTDAELRAADVPVDVSDRIDRLLGRITHYDTLANGTLGALNATVELQCAGLGTVGVGISGTWVGTIVAETTLGDGVWDPIPLLDNTMGSGALTTTVNGNFLLGVGGALTLRIRMSLYTSGTATVYLEGTAATNGVFLTRSLPTGYNPIGTVTVGAAVELSAYGQTTVAEATLTRPNDTAVYAAGDVVSNSTGAPVVQPISVARENAGGGVIQSAVLVVSANQATKGDFEVWLFDTVPTAMEDNAAFDPTAAEMANLVGVIDFGGAPLVGNAGAGAAGNCVYTVDAPSLPYKCGAGTTNLWWVLVVRNAYTPTAVEVYTLRLGDLQD